MLKGFLSRLPLTDRITFSRELLSAPSSSGALSLNAIFWLIAALLSLGAVMMMLFARSVPYSSSSALSR